MASAIESMCAESRDVNRVIQRSNTLQGVPDGVAKPRSFTRRTIRFHLVEDCLCVCWTPPGRADIREHLQNLAHEFHYNLDLHV